MKKKLFGQNISPNCSYCANTYIKNQILYCQKNKEIKNGKCKAFRYDPLLRSPKVSVFNSKYSAEDFKL